MFSAKSLIYACKHGVSDAKVREVETSADYYELIPRKLKVKIEEELLSLADYFVNTNMPINLQTLVREVSSMMYENWRVLASDRVVESLLKRFILEVHPDHRFID